MRIYAIVIKEDLSAMERKGGGEFKRKAFDCNEISSV
jgi:hypothetical protein